MSHLDAFSDEQRAVLDALADTYRRLWHVRIERIHDLNGDPYGTARSMQAALAQVIASDAMRLELARRCYTVVLHDGGGVQPTSEEGTVIVAYHDEAAQLCWSGEVIRWFADLAGHLVDDANDLDAGATRH